MRSRKPPKTKTPSITEQIRAKDEEQRLRDKAYEIWEKRGKTGTLEENWDAAIKALKWQRLLQPFSNFWHWTGIQEKKGWEVVQLLVGISIPIVLFVGGQYFTTQNNEKQQKLADDKTTQDRQLADDKNKQDTLVKYLDQMADSLQHGLLKANPGDDQFIVAQSRTVLALQSLDKKRQHLVIQFLQTAGLNKVGEQTKPNQDGKIQLKKSDKVLLYQAQMSKAILANSDLSGGVLIGVNLEQANLGCYPRESKDSGQCSDWSGAHLNKATLSGATLSGATLSGAHLSDADLSDATLSGAHLSGAHLSGAHLNKAHLNKAHLFDATLSGADLGSADLSDATLILAHLNKAHLSGAHLSDATLSGAHLSDATLDGAHLRLARLGSADLSGADLSGADLLATDLRGAKNFDPRQLRGERQPLLCNVALSADFKDKDKLKDRDCDRLPQKLLERDPQRFSSLEAAKKYVDEARQKKLK